MARCKICGKDLRTYKGYRKHINNCEFELSMKETDDLLIEIKKRNRL